VTAAKRLVTVGLLGLLGLNATTGCTFFARTTPRGAEQRHEVTGVVVPPPAPTPTAPETVSPVTPAPPAPPPASVHADAQSPIRETRIEGTALPAGPTPLVTTGLAERARSADYRIGEEDELAISVYGDPELSKTQAVRPGGKISLPLVGDVTAAGLTPEDLRAEIAKRLSDYVRNPRVTVIVAKYSSRRISVLGEVRMPGLLVMSSEITLLEAIARAGGLSGDADLQGALLVRRGQSQPVNFEKLFRQGDGNQNVLLEPDDTILIPNVKDKRVVVLGQVNKPLVVSLTPGLTLMESISRAGGLTEDADLQGALLLREGQVQPVNFDKLLREGDLSQNVLLKPDDSILIPSIKDKKAFVLGQVNKPLVVPLTPGVTLIESISRAGGITDDADLQGALLVRDGKAQAVDFDRLLKHGDASQNVLLRANDVIMLPSLKDKKVFVLGEVNRPAVVALRSGITLVEAIAHAGGFTPDAKRSNILVVRGGLGHPTVLTVDVDQITQQGGVEANVPLQPGDIVYAPRTLVANVVKFFQTITTILTPALLASSGIVLGPSVEAVLTGRGAQTVTPVVVNR
jgi:polysaccharide export outer membrane protein